MRAHTSHLTTEFLDWKIPNRIPHPPKSLDLNPIEKVWSFLEARVLARRPHTLEELRTTLLDEWNRITLEEIGHVIDQLHTEMTGIIAHSSDFVDRQWTRVYKSTK